MIRFLNMVLVFLVVVLFFRCTNSSQDNTIKSVDTSDDTPANSYSSEDDNTTIKYSYSENSQIHDYSNNWDFDGDGILDKIMFVGNGGAHLYFRLLIHLSGLDTIFYYNYLYTDMPMYEPIDSLRKNDNGLFPVFVVYDFTKDGKDDIYLKMSKNDYDSHKMNELEISSNQIVLSYDEKRKEFIINDYIKQLKK